MVDTHTHYVPPSYRTALLGEAERSPAFAAQHRLRLLSTAQPDAPANRADLRLEDMAVSGVDHALVSLPPPAASLLGAAVARDANDELLGTASASRGRLSVLVSLPLPDLDASLAELERVAAHPRLAGIQVLTTGAGLEQAPDRAEAVLAAAAARGLPVVLHPAVEPLPPVYDDWLLEATLGPVMSSTVAFARLVLSGTLDRLPDLQLVVPHLGGFLPYVVQRVSDFGRGRAEHDLAHYLRTRVHLDTCSYHPPALRCAVETVGADRLVLGTDYPFRGAQQRGVDDVRTFFRGDPAGADAVLGRTAQHLFPTLAGLQV
ncbi:MAG: amidohydrolase [Frankiales bacterium]|nr:amidohydrolase [Frankiales bacterium]